MLKIYNSLTKSKEVFTPLTPGVVKMYLCGMTVYDYCHVGHSRSMLAFDVVFRYLTHLGFKVEFVRNYTDIDDKIIKRALEQNISTTELSEKFIQATQEDFASLGLLSPTIEPKATEHIPEMISIIQTLINKGLAYQAGPDVFFNVRAFKGYGKLSGKNIEELESGARIDVMDIKHDPLDFVLWKGVKPGEPSWSSPFGDGRPGWHIECSAMSSKYLGETFDIHGGGKDLVFPHHENEIAQSEGANEKPFAKYWMHAGHLNINSVKMSKSLGNFLTIRDLVARYPSEGIRLFLLSAHYRSPLDYTHNLMKNSLAALERFYKTKQKILESPESNDTFVESDPELTKWLTNFEKDFTKAMNDDFNSAKVVGLIFEGVRECNRVLNQKGSLSQSERQMLLGHFDLVDKILGLFGSTPQTFFESLKAKGLEHIEIDPSEIEAMIVQRKEARLQKNYALSDEIRDTLKTMGVLLQDKNDGGTEWFLA